MPETVLERRNRTLGTGAPLFYQDPVHIVRGEGVTLFDPDGRRYVDMYNNVPCVGHCHPHVVEAITRQAATLNVHSRYLHEGILEYAERLAGHHHAKLDSVVFECTGTEANEVALMMARLATGGRGIVCTDAAYHGNSAEVRKLTRPKSNDGEVRAIPFPETYRYAHNEDPTAWHLERLRAVIASFAEDDIAFAGMLVCPILANEGLPNIPPGFMAAAREIVHEVGGLFIADEVQAGLCRTGQWWGYETMDFEPDIAVMGKPIGAGMPLAAVAASRDLVETFRRGTGYFNTFASSPLQAAAGNAVLDVIERENLRANVASVGTVMRDRLRKLQDGCEPMGDVRGHGLFIGIEWVEDRVGKAPDRAGAIAVVNALKDKGFLIGNAGAFGNVVKIRPPLVFSADDAAAFLDAFEETLDDLGCR
ncbi:MAG: aspartate aminotransferase family protein [Gammaproteobacteria bacterium]|nr:aspartate aminotransferase family protein [Gammaproteobacteria bacterium]